MCVKFCFIEFWGSAAGNSGRPNSGTPHKHKYAERRLKTATDGNDGEGRRRTANDGEGRLITANDSLNYLEYWKFKQNGINTQNLVSSKLQPSKENTNHVAIYPVAGRRCENT